MGDTKYKCTHDKERARWVDVEAYDPEEAATSYCKVMMDRDWHSAPLTQQDEDCTVYVHPDSDPTDETEWNVRCVYETPTFYAEQL